MLKYVKIELMYVYSIKIIYNFVEYFETNL